LLQRNDGIVTVTVRPTTGQIVPPLYIWLATGRLRTECIGFASVYAAG